MTVVAVLGLGAMGSRIAARLCSGGHDVIVWNRTVGKLASLIEGGATAVATPAEAAARADFLITTVADPAALHAIVRRPDGIAAGAHRELMVIEMSTVGPAAIGRLRESLPRAVALVDAPVLGSIGEAQAGSLTIFAGGAAAAIERARPLLSELGSVFAVGPLGAGAAAKLIVNGALFGTLVTLGEALALGRGLGLTDETLFELLSVTPVAEQAERRRAAIEAGTYPPRFALSLAHKDAELVTDAARAATVELRVAEAARRWLADAESAGSGSRDYTAVLATILGRPRATSTRGGADGPGSAGGRSPSAAVPKIIGIVNITEDSFSDGGLYLDPGDAVAHARALSAEGADVIELGPASSHPDAAPVTAEEECRRLAPVIEPLVADGVRVSVDSFLPETQRFALARGAEYLNDIHGFPDPSRYAGLAAADCRLIVMHSVQLRGRATLMSTDPTGIVERIERFFAERLEALTTAGIPQDRLIIDPGLGYFLGSNPEPSLVVMGVLRRLKARFHVPVLVSPSRKSFLRNVTGRAVDDVGAASLAAELYAASQGVDYIRTHDVAALRDALTVSHAIAVTAGSSERSVPR